MSHIYTTPLYLKETWATARKIQEQVLKHKCSFVEPRDFSEFTAVVQNVTCADDMHWLLEEIFRDGQYNAQRKAICIVRDLLDEENTDNTHAFGTGEWLDGDEQYAVDFTLEMISESGDAHSFLGSFGQYGANSRAIYINTNEDRSNITPIPEMDSYEFHIWRHVITDRAVSEMLKTTNKVWKDISPIVQDIRSNPNYLLSLLPKLAEGAKGENFDLNSFAEAAFGIRADEYSKKIMKAVFLLIIIRFINAFSLFGMCKQETEAFDWFFSCDGPAFQGTTAAELTADMAEAWQIDEGTYPDFLASLKAEKAE